MTSSLRMPLASLALELTEGRVSARSLVEESLAAIAEDPRAFVSVAADRARQEAEEIDLARRKGRSLSPWAGIPISVKDLFDVAGEVTRAGAKALAERAPAEHDAAVVARLRAAGFIIMGRTQMSEYAFTGNGLNPHVPQPVNPLDPERAPGGSSGGAGVSVALAQVQCAIGTDTGGSVRIPAAWCGVVGFKPTQSRISRAGAYPLSQNLDSIGPLCRTVDDCRILDRIMADDPTPDDAPGPMTDIVLAIPDRVVLDDVAPEVAVAWERALDKIASAGMILAALPFPELDAMIEANARGTLSNAEAYAAHRRARLLDRREAYDPNVLARVEIGSGMSAADYLDLLARRESLIADAEARTAPFHAVIAPTTPNLAPRFTEISDPAAFARENALALRNTSVANFLDRCAISLPMASDRAPAGFMMIGARMADAQLLRIAERIAPLIA